MKKDWSNACFSRKREWTASDGTETRARWVSWTEIAKVENPSAIPLMIKSGKIWTRPHESLDHQDEDVNQPPVYEQLQFRWAAKEEITANLSSDKMVLDDEFMPDDPTAASSADAHSSRSHSTAGRRPAAG